MGKHSLWWQRSKPQERVGCSGIYLEYVRKMNSTRRFVAGCYLCCGVPPVLETFIKLQRQRLRKSRLESLLLGLMWFMTKPRDLSWSSIGCLVAGYILVDRAQKYRIAIEASLKRCDMDECTTFPWWMPIARDACLGRTPRVRERPGGCDPDISPPWWEYTSQVTSTKEHDLVLLEALLFCMALPRPVDYNTVDMSQQDTMVLYFPPYKVWL